MSSKHGCLAANSLTTAPVPSVLALSTTSTPAGAVSCAASAVRVAVMPAASLWAGTTTQSSTRCPSAFTLELQEDDAQADAAGQAEQRHPVARAAPALL